MALRPAHRPAQEWLADLQKAKAEASTGYKPKMTIQDLLERFNGACGAAASVRGGGRRRRLT